MRRLYLVQHGEAVGKDIDPERPLSERGHEEVRRMSSFLRRAGVCAERVLNSGKRRAEQTAEVLAGVVLASGSAEMRHGMLPKDSVDAVAGEIAGWSADIMLVGHMPFMARLASLLLTGDAVSLTVSFRPGSVVCLEEGDDGAWDIAWMIRPELLVGV
jgi:phosphohistidine phosphatase